MTNSDYYLDELNAEKARKDYEFKRKALQEAFRDVLDTQAGITVLKWILEQSGVMMCHPSLTIEKMSFMEGRRSIGLSILQECGAFGVYDMLLAKPITEESSNVRRNHE